MVSANKMILNFLRKIPSLFQFKAPLVFSLVLGLITLGVFWPASRCNFVAYDDPDYVTDNPHVLNGLTLQGASWALMTGHACNWHPLTWMSLMLDASIFGSGPYGFHLTNILLHAIDVSLLFCLLWYLTGAKWRSALVASLFGLHPLRVESVAWISERKDVLSAFFGLITLLCYVRYTRVQGENRAVYESGGTGGNIQFGTVLPSFSSRYYWLALAFFGLGLMSKPILVTWPFVMLLLDYWPLRRWRAGCFNSLLIEKIPFFCLTMLASVITFLAQRGGGAVVGIESLPFFIRGGNALVSYWRYLGKIFWPQDLIVFYSYSRFWPAEQVFLAGVALIVLTIFLYLIRDRYPYLLMGWLWFCGTLVPVIGLVQAGGQSIADRYTYLPVIGILVMVAWGAFDLATQWHWGRIVFPAAGVMVVIICSVLTRRQLSFWRDSETLFRHSLAISSDNWVIHNNLGVVLNGEGKTDEACAQIEMALQYNPRDPKGHNDLGAIFEKQGKHDAAIAEFQESIRLNPNYETSRKNLGSTFFIQGRLDAAISQYREALRLDPDSAQTHFDLAVALDRAGQGTEAAREYQAALHAEPGDVDAYDDFGVFLAKTGKMNEAIDQFRKAIRIQPNRAEAHNNLGMALKSERRTTEAIREFQEAVRLDPQYAIARYNLGYLWIQRGENLEQAREMAVRALQLEPQNPNFLGIMGWVLLKENHGREGIPYLLQAITNSPAPNAEFYDHLGEAYAAIHQYESAAGAWRKSLEISTNPEVAERLQKLGVQPKDNARR